MSENEKFIGKPGQGKAYPTFRDLSRTIINSNKERTDSDSLFYHSEVNLLESILGSYMTDVRNKSEENKDGIITKKLSDYAMDLKKSNKLENLPNVSERGRLLEGVFAGVMYAIRQYEHEMEKVKLLYKIL